MPGKDTDMEWGKGLPKAPSAPNPWQDPLSTPSPWLTWLKSRLEIDPPQFLASDIVGGSSGGFGEGTKLHATNLSSVAGPVTVSWAVGTFDEVDNLGFLDLGTPTNIVIPSGLDGFYAIVFHFHLGGE